MSIFSYKLTQLHKQLDDQIRVEMKRRMPDALRLLRLKRLRLSVKDLFQANQCLRIQGLGWFIQEEDLGFADQNGC